MSQIQSLSGHTVICGYGRLARFCAERLRESGHLLVVVENAAERVAAAEEDGYLVIDGDATEESVIESAGISRASQLVSLLPKDADNLYAVLTARELNPDLIIISRAESANGEKRIKRAGATRIMWPYRLGGEKIADAILRPHVNNFIELAVSPKHQGLLIEEVRITDESKGVGMRIGELPLDGLDKVMVAAVVGADGQIEVSPTTELRLEPQSTLLLVGENEQVRQFESRISS